MTVVPGRMLAQVMGVSSPTVPFDMEHTGRSAALDKGEYSVLEGGCAATALLGLAFQATDESLVHFDRATVAAERRVLDGCHGKADTMGHEPSGLVGDAEHTVQLVGRDALLAGRHQVRGENPLVERNLGVLKDRANRHGERLTALVALVDAGTVAFALHPCDAVLIDVAAAGTGRAVRPVEHLQMLTGGVGVGVDWIGEVNYDESSSH